MSDSLELQKIVAEVAAAYFNNRHVTPTEIPTVVRRIAESLVAVGASAAEMPTEAPEQPKLTPAQIRRSITRDALISFEDNKPYKTLRRHLASKGLTPDDYRNRWGLPKDYPMVAPAYSEARSKMAKALGFGSRVQARPNAAPPAAAAPAKTTAPSKVTKTRAKSPARPRATNGATKKPQAKPGV